MPIVSYSEQDIEDIHKAGKLLSKIFKKVIPQIKPGRKVTDIVDSVEYLIKKNGAQTAFPCNLSANTDILPLGCKQRIRPSLR